MDNHKEYMLRAIELAEMGKGKVSINPLVGCVIVKDNQIIGEGFHTAYGKAHAEVEAVNSVKNPDEIEGAFVYVNLEPCAHYGKTPPCADLLISRKVKKVFIANTDPYFEVSGKGIEKLKAAGIEVELGLCAEEGRNLNKRFFTFQEKKRPWVLLKWAQTYEGFIGPDQHLNPDLYAQNRPISSEDSKYLIHKWRAEEDAILVGYRTVLLDDPLLDARYYNNKILTRMVFDPKGALKAEGRFFRPEGKVLVFNHFMDKVENNIEWIRVGGRNPYAEILAKAFERNIQSVMVEGGKGVLDNFIMEGLWDEARIIYGEKYLPGGTPAPRISGKEKITFDLGKDKVRVLTRI